MNNKGKILLSMIAGYIISLAIGFLIFAILDRLIGKNFINYKH